MKRIGTILPFVCLLLVATEAEGQLPRDVGRKSLKGLEAVFLEVVLNDLPFPIQVDQDGRPSLMPAPSISKVAGMSRDQIADFVAAELKSHGVRVVLLDPAKVRETKKLKVPAGMVLNIWKGIRCKGPAGVVTTAYCVQWQFFQGVKLWRQPEIEVVAITWVSRPLMLTDVELSPQRSLTLQMILKSWANTFAADFLEANPTRESAIRQRN